MSVKGLLNCHFFPSIFAFPSEFEALRKCRLQTENFPDEDGYDHFRQTNFRLDLVLRRVFTARMFFIDELDRASEYKHMLIF